MTLSKFETKQAAEAYLFANFESDDAPMASTGVARVLLICRTQACFMKIEPGFYINVELDHAGL